MWTWITTSRTNKTVTIIAIALTVFALVSALGAWHFRAKMQEARKAEKVQAEKIESMTKEAEARDLAYRKALGATEIPLKNALQGVWEAKASLAQVEASRRELWIPPAVDSGELVARFEKALEAIK